MRRPTARPDRASAATALATTALAATALAAATLAAPARPAGAQAPAAASPAAPVAAGAALARPQGPQGRVSGVSAGAVVRPAALALGGTWELDAARSDFGPQPVPSRMTRRIAVTEAAVEMLVRQTTPRGEVSGTFRCPIGGEACRNDQAGTATVGAARWDGDVLVVRTTLPRLIGPHLTTIDRYVVSPDGRELVVERAWEAVGAGTRARMVFLRGG